MSKVLSLIVPALALAATTFYSPEADAGGVRIVVNAPVKAPPATRVWIAGHYEMRAGHAVWVPGHYKVVPVGKAAWVPGHWEMRRGKKVWIAGHWR